MDCVVSAVVRLCCFSYCWTVLFQLLWDCVVSVIVGLCCLSDQWTMLFE